jgi:hypothetical protein
LPRLLRLILTTFVLRAGIEKRAEPIRIRSEVLVVPAGALLNSSALPLQATAPLQAIGSEATPAAETVAVEPDEACGSLTGVGGGGGGGGAGGGGCGWG